MNKVIANKVGYNLDQEGTDKGSALCRELNMLWEDKRVVPDQVEHFLPPGLEWWTTCQHVEEQDAKSPPRKPLISICIDRSKKVATKYSNWFSRKDVKFA